MLNKAVEYACKHPEPGRYRFAAIACDKAGNILAVGHNSYIKTHPVQAKAAIKVGQPNRPFLHAEIAALVKARGVVYSLSVARVTKDGSPANAEPCPICREAMRQAGVKLVEWTK